MELILWRHAEAEDGGDDMKRELTKRGKRQTICTLTVQPGARVGLSPTSP